MLWIPIERSLAKLLSLSNLAIWNAILWEWSAFIRSDVMCWSRHWGSISQIRSRFLGDATGLHLVARFPRVKFTPEIIAVIESSGVHVYPVERHAIVKDQHLNEIILGYSHLSPAQIERGIGPIKLAIG